MADFRDSAVMEWTLGDRLRKARRVAGMTTEDMAARVGKSRQAVNGYEQDSHAPALAVLAAWAEATEVPFDWLCLGQSSTKWYIPPSRAA